MILRLVFSLLLEFCFLFSSFSFSFFFFFFHGIRACTRTRLYCVYIPVQPVSLTLDKHLHEFKTAARKLVKSKEQQAHLEIPQDHALILGTSFPLTLSRGPFLSISLV